MKMKKCLLLMLLLVSLASFADAQEGIKVAVDDEGVPIFQMQDVRIRALGTSKRDQRRSSGRRPTSTFMPIR